MDGNTMPLHALLWHCRNGYCTYLLHHSHSSTCNQFQIWCPDFYQHVHLLFLHLWLPGTEKSLNDNKETKIHHHPCLDGNTLVISTCIMGSLRNWHRESLFSWMWYSSRDSINIEAGAVAQVTAANFYDIIFGSILNETRSIRFQDIFFFTLLIFNCTVTVWSGSIMLW